MTDKPLKRLGRVAHSIAREKGFYENPPTIPDRLCLIHSEISEALEAYRDDKVDIYFRDNAKPDGLIVELADAIIRIVDLAYYLGLDIDEAVALKMSYNAGRPYQHGRARL
jgi:NTP pyrophosphatase (non-canonical NTP hydrolase)